MSEIKATATETTASKVNAAVATARDLPDMVAKISRVDPALAEQISGKSLIAAKSPWGTLAAGGVSWLVAKYGLGWDETMVNLVAGVGVLVGAYIMRMITTSPISGWFRKQDPTQMVTTAVVTPPS